jgi:AraC-like DNA-binding protein
MLLSRNYPPSDALADVVARHYIFEAPLPADFEMIDSLLSETGFIRVLVSGDWAGEVEPGVWARPSDVLFFGPNARPLRVRVRGPFHVIGVAIRPCGWKRLWADGAERYVDCLLPLGELWGTDIAKEFEGLGGLSDTDVIARCESAIRTRMASIGPAPVSEAMKTLEDIARNDSTMPVARVADRLGLSERQLERVTKAHFGHSPKFLLRRSRFLDMATVLRGLGDPSDDYLAELRYFDESHKTREFKRFCGMTPAEFERRPTPLLTAGLELRYERKRLRPS